MENESVPKVELIPNANQWWKRYSTWLALSLPALAVAKDAIPALQGVIPDDAYRTITGVLGFVIVLAVHIKQASLNP